MLFYDIYFYAHVVANMLWGYSLDAVLQVARLLLFDVSWTINTTTIAVIIAYDKLSVDRLHSWLTMLNEIGD